MTLLATSKILKVDSTLGLVLGFAVVCKDEDGSDHYDLQGHHIPEQVMLDAATDFMLHKRVASDMHEGDERGSVVFAFPLTTEIAEAFGIVTKKTGLMIAMKPDEEMLAKFASGEYTGFSIGGGGKLEEVVSA